MAAPGPSLEPIHYGPIIAVQDAWRLVPWADVLYGCDPHWWEYHKGTGFKGEKWSTHNHKSEELETNDKSKAHDQYGVRCVLGCMGNEFSLDPAVIHFGNNSGFQAINLAILFGCTHITLIGFDMRAVDGKSHFFGNHPQELQTGIDYERFVKYYDCAARKLPDHIRIVNATPDSALRCFPMMSLEKAMQEKYVHDSD